MPPCACLCVAASVAVHVRRGLLLNLFLFYPVLSIHPILFPM